MGWEYPATFIDDDSKWTGEANAYDEDTDTHAYNRYNETQHWLQLLFTPEMVGLAKSVSQIKIHCKENMGSSTGPELRIEIFDDDESEWVLVFEGTIPDETWTTKDIPSGPLNITGARVYQVSKNGMYTQVYLNEFMFNVVPAFKPAWAGRSNNLLGVA